MARSLYDYCVENDAFELLVQWDKQKNGKLTYRDVAKGSHQKVWWKCAFGHSWQAVVYTRTGQHSGCPYCAGRLPTLPDKVLADGYPELARQWHTGKNLDLTPRNVAPGSRRRVWWRCEKGHEWQAAISSRTSMGTGCPICAGKIVVPGVNDLASQKPHIAAQWHPEKNGALTPQKVTPYSNRYAWWLCEKGHTYRTVIAHRSRTESDCPYCKNRKVLVGFNDLATLKPQIAAQWHPELNEPLTPQMVTPGSSKKVWWQCADGHIWKAVIYSRTSDMQCGCPVCSGRVKQNEQFRDVDIVADRLNKKK